MKRIMLMALTLLLACSLCSAAFAAEAVKGEGSADKDYITYFTGISYANPSSKIKATVNNGVLAIDYSLASSGWLGTCSGKILEDWSGFTGLKFNLAGGTNGKVRVVLTDGNDVLYQTTIVDDSKAGQVVEMPFAKFAKRTDYQTPGVNTNKPYSLKPVVSLNIEPITPGKGKIQVSEVKLYK